MWLGRHRRPVEARIWLPQGLAYPQGRQARREAQSTSVRQVWDPRTGCVRLRGSKILPMIRVQHPSRPGLPEMAHEILAFAIQLALNS